MASAGAALIIEEGLLAAVRERAQRVGRPESELVEEALRRYLGLDGLLEQIWAASPDDLSEQESLELAYSELRAARVERP
ncbi:MAG: ribbon-helix-helix protein, CopG family [Nitriliruptorales bacterium]|nr:ribbon-helix-helix protein, CopG family [Nitriliruptorales bacterium]